MLPPPNPDKNEQFQQRKPGRNFTSAYGIMSISTLYRDALQKYGKLVLDFEEHASPLAPTFQAHSVGIKIRYSERIPSKTDSIALQSLDFGGPAAELCVDRLSSEEEKSSQPPKRDD